MVINSPDKPASLHPIIGSSRLGASTDLHDRPAPTAAPPRGIQGRRAAERGWVPFWDPKKTDGGFEDAGGFRFFFQILWIFSNFYKIHKIDRSIVDDFSIF